MKNLFLKYRKILYVCMFFYYQFFTPLIKNFKKYTDKAGSVLLVSYNVFAFSENRNTCLNIKKSGS